MSGIRVIVTYNCNIMCSHCKYKCGPHRKGVMEPGLFRSKVIKVCEESSIDYLIIEGGEALLHAGVVYKYLKKIKNIGCKKYIVTNGFWGDMEPYISILEDLKDIGLYGVIIEYDYFHSPFIKLSTVKGAIEKALLNNLNVSVRASFTTGDLGTEEDKATFTYIKDIRSSFKNIGFVFDEMNNVDLSLWVKRKLCERERLILYKEA